MEEKGFNNIYAIPANYTDSGKLFGGMLEVRNTIEAAALLLMIGYPELMWLPVSGTIKVVLMTITLLPLGVVALMGIAGDSLLQYFGHIVRHWIKRRKVHYRRIGYRYESEDIKGTPKEERVKKPKGNKKQKRDKERNADKEKRED